jgi:cysteine desulfurase / selenocysteine lyase
MSTEAEIAVAVSKMKYDVNRIREDFPILKKKVHDKNLVYLDNAATTQKPTYVIDRVNK